jgi:hypothetical protein
VSHDVRRRPTLFGSVTVVAAALVVLVVALMMLQSVMASPSHSAGPTTDADSLALVTPPSPAAEVRITSPTSDEVVHERTPTIGGTGQSGTSVTVFGEENRVLCSAWVRQSTWSCESGLPMGDGATGVVASQVGAEPPSKASVSFTVERGVTLSDALPVFVAIGLLAFALLAVAARQERRREGVQ